MNIVIVGAGRAGRSFDVALRAAGHQVQLVHHGDSPTSRDPALDVVLLTVPDDALPDSAARLAVAPETVVAHVAGSRGLDVLGAHARVGSLHPLAILPDTDRGAVRLRGGIFCVQGDTRLVRIVDSLEGRVIDIRPEARTLYHAAAVAASNHLVALLAHVDALARGAGLELNDFLVLARQALDDSASRGPARALTGPAARGDLATVDAHLRAVPDDELDTYRVLAERAWRLAHDREPVPWSA